MKFTLTMQSCGSAFSDLPQVEVARMLEQLAERVRNGDEWDGGYMFDINGNRVGEWSLDSAQTQGRKRNRR